MGSLAIVEALVVVLHYLLPESYYYCIALQHVTSAIHSFRAQKILQGDPINISKSLIVYTIPNSPLDHDSLYPGNAVYLY